MTEEEILAAKWFAVMDDTMGRWAVATVDKPVSEIDKRPGSGERVVGWWLAEEVAKEVAREHNSPNPITKFAKVIGNFGKSYASFADKFIGRLKAFEDRERRERMAEFERTMPDRLAKAIAQGRAEAEDLGRRYNFIPPHRIMQGAEASE